MLTDVSRYLGGGIIKMFEMQIGKRTEKPTSLDFNTQRR